MTSIGKDILFHPGSGAFATIPANLCDIQCQKSPREGTLLLESRDQLAMNYLWFEVSAKTVECSLTKTSLIYTMLINRAVPGAGAN